MGDADQAPPPYLSESNNVETLLMVYTSTTQHQSTSASSKVTQILTFRSSPSGRVLFSVSIPKKREGWKAELYSVNEKGRQQLSSRRFDFRDAEGYHNVMFPSTSLSNKNYLMESPDGQKLMWKRKDEGWVLLSMPSQTIVAQFTSIKSQHQHSKADHLNIGRLDMMILPTETEPTLLDKNRRTNTNLSTSSTSTSEGGSRLGRSYQRCSVGVCIPGAIIAAIASPHASTGMSCKSILGDELVNLGRGTIKPVSHPQRETSNIKQVFDASWVQTNRSDIIRNDDPRPRRVDLDLIVSSFIAVLAG